MTAQQIIEIIDGSNFCIFGIRALHADESPALGSEMPESYVWDDGNRTEDAIGGTCCFVIPEMIAGYDAQSALDKAAKYTVSSNRRYALLGGNYTGNNDLIEEADTVAIRDAVVLAIWEHQ